MRLVAITSCPTGIAHSQMAAENLKNTAEELGHEISVEVQGAMGTEDELTADEISEADAVIIAADTAVSQDRFEGKPLVKGTVKDGVNSAEQLVEDAVELAEEGSAATVEVAGSSGEEETETKTAQSGPSDDAAPEEAQLGGDPSKGLFARLKRFLG
jgi:PTS system fructose-specific IIB component